MIKETRNHIVDKGKKPMKTLIVTSLLLLTTTNSLAVIPQDSINSLPISLTQNVTPYIIPPADGNERGGNRTCADVGKAYYGNPLYFQCYTNKKDYPFLNNPELFEPNIDLPIECANSINVEIINDTFINWVSTNPVGAAIIKGGSDANTYVYDPQTTNDTGLASPINSSGNPANLSNIGGFCWNPENTNNECFNNETAWAANSVSYGNLKYVKRGNWATYVKYEPNKIVTLFAGQRINIGTVTFNTNINNTILITIQLDDNWVFALNYELDENGNIKLDELGNPIRDNNIKIQDYENAPIETPAPGLFDWKVVGIGQYKEITIPFNNFYGIHIDVAYPIECNN